MKLKLASLELNAASLLASSLITAILGLVYWAIAANHFPEAEVGQATAVVSTATMLGTLATLSLGGMYERFILSSGKKATTFIWQGIALCCVAGLLLGFIFIFAMPDSRLFGNSLERWLFPFMVVSFTLFAVLDPILTGLGRATWVGLKNIPFSLIKLIPVMLFSASASALTITGSWTLLAVFTSAIFTFVAMRYSTRKLGGQKSTLPPTRELWHYQLAAFSMTLLGSVTPLMLPLLVIENLGAVQNAYFNITWMICSAVNMAYAALMTSYVVEASTCLDDLARPTRKFLKLLAVAAIVCSICLAVFGPVVLAVVGDSYQTQGTPLLRIMALTALFQGIIAAYSAISKVFRRLRLLVVVQILAVIGTLSGSFIAVTRFTLTEVGWAHLFTDALLTCVILVPFLKLLKEIFPKNSAVVSEPEVRIDSVK